MFAFLFIFILFSKWILIKGEGTSIHGFVLSEKNESSWLLENNNVILMIKNVRDIYHFKLKINEINFPFRFNLTNIKQIKTNGIYLLSLLIFGYSHRLIWEGILFQQYLMINHTNSITFILKDVCKRFILIIFFIL